MKHILFLLTLIPCFSMAQENPYRFSWKGDLAVTAIGTAGSIYGFYGKRRIQPLTEAELLALDPADINSFDRTAIQYWSVPTSDASDVFLIASMVVPFTLFADKDIRKGFSSVLLMYTETFLINQALTDITKNSVLRTRPLAYNPDVPEAEKYKITTPRAFFSGHTSTAAAMSFFTAKVFNDFFPHSNLRPAIWSAAAVVPAITGYLRYRAGKHFPTDVIAGYAVGATIGFLVPHFHKIRKDKSASSLQVYPTIQGLGMNLQF